MDSIVWCEQSYPIKEFLQKFSLPQIVQVDNGYYGATDDNTLSQGQIILLHQVVRVDKVKVSVPLEEDLIRTIYVPLDCRELVEILPKGGRGRYSHMKELLRDSPGFVRAIHNTPWLGLKPGDILKVREVARDGRQNYVVFEFLDRDQDIQVRIPLDYEIAFEALAARQPFSLKDAVEMFQLPVWVRFMKSGSGVVGLGRATNITSLEGAVVLEQVSEEEAIIATSREGQFVTVLDIPADLDVSVLPAIGAVTNNQGYTSLCRSIHQSAKIDALADLNRARDDMLGVERLSEYEELAPLLPPKSARISSTETSAVAGDKEHSQCRLESAI